MIEIVNQLYEISFWNYVFLPFDKYTRVIHQYNDISFVWFATIYPFDVVIQMLLVNKLLTNWRLKKLFFSRKIVSILAYCSFPFVRIFYRKVCKNSKAIQYTLSQRNERGMLRTRLCGIFTVAAAARTMAYRFYEPRLVQHCKQSAYLLHGSLILVQVKYKRGHLRPILPHSFSMDATELQYLCAYR